jgi:hypothetical protein
MGGKFYMMQVGPDGYHWHPEISERIGNMILEQSEKEKYGRL